MVAAVEVVTTGKWRGRRNGRTVVNCSRRIRVSAEARFVVFLTELASVLNTRHTIGVAGACCAIKSARTCFPCLLPRSSCDFFSFYCCRLTFRELLFCFSSPLSRITSGIDAQESAEQRLGVDAEIERRRPCRFQGAGCFWSIPHDDLVRL